ANAAKGQISTASAEAKVKEMAGTSTTAQNNAMEKIQVKALESAGYVKVTANVSGMASAGSYVKAEELNADGSANTATGVTPTTNGTAATAFGSDPLKTAYNRQLDAYDGVRATDMSAKDKYDGAEYLQIGAETDADPTERANQVV
ncbi:hypothetical protein ACTQ56_13395, partial [[Clostridium] aminophilum]|uniref:hypothetical protein n=1 Tax=[Clostridium] aminophilum TaxID=1526 RepID=UPI003F98E2BE